MNGPQRVVYGAWLAMIGLSVARSLGRNAGLPQPNIFIASAVLFSGYYIAASFLGAFPAVLAVATDVAVVALPYLRGGTTGPLDTIASALSSISGDGGPGGEAAKPKPAGPGGSSGNLAPAP